MKRALIICTGNSCRSQMAEGLLRHLAGERFQVFSAGISPSVLHPMAVEVMGEAGIDITGQVSEGVETYASRSFDLVVTVCDHARESCPAFPAGTERAHWGLEDPALARGTDEERREVFRRVRDQIRARIGELASAAP